MTPEIEARYASLSVPRYTSYPTAPHFSGDVGPETARGWLAAIPAGDPVSLYLHVPFCRAICHYCGCHTKASLRDGPLIDYAAVLINEIGLVSRFIGSRQPVSHIHWGGGTPSLLPRDSLLAVIAAVAAHFDVLPDAEHAMELDPRSVDVELAATLVEAGINRASLGVQDFDAKVQHAIGRIQSVETVQAAVDALRGAGIEAINFDLMYGLPHQTAAGIDATVRQAVAFRPSRIALFGYAHVPWFKLHQRLIDDAALPGTQARLELEAAAHAALAAAGYVAIGLDHFARADDSMAIAAAEGRLARNFQGYTTDDAKTLIGLGASSIGRLPNGYVQNIQDVGGWGAAIESGHLATVKGKELSLEDRLRGAIIERLMCDFTVDTGDVCRAFGVKQSMLMGSVAALDRLVVDGLAEVTDTRVSVTEAGRPLVRVVAAAFDAYLARPNARHSVAV
ncbi:MAG: oxygen-independent coproporphyrinogen III oxidase [Ancalomicrobiaceae bacterium]|nr:oxygen-independent coproporphyrinogen III oxidase [Ancalomicrobiaceae bacterium]